MYGYVKDRGVLSQRCGLPVAEAQACQRTYFGDLGDRAGQNKKPLNSAQVVFIDRACTLPSLFPALRGSKGSPKSSTDRLSWNLFNGADMSNALTSRAYHDLEKHPEHAPSPNANTPLLHHTNSYARARVSLSAHSKVAYRRDSRRWIAVLPGSSWNRSLLLMFLCALVVFGHALFGLGLQDLGVSRVRNEFHELHWHPYAHVLPQRPSRRIGDSDGVIVKSASAPIQALTVHPQEALFPPPHPHGLTALDPALAIEHASPVYGSHPAQRDELMDDASDWDPRYYP
ncbi:hypothetical protein J3A83DRAFT_4201634, partial [Scleroderma citrinum]